MPLSPAPRKGYAQRCWCGGIDNGGPLTLSHSSVSGNTPGLQGRGNWARQGGGIYIYSHGANTTLSYSTVTGNTASSIGQRHGGGGGIYIDAYNDRPLTLSHSSVTHNQPDNCEHASKSADHGLDGFRTAC